MTKRYKYLITGVTILLLLTWLWCYRLECLYFFQYQRVKNLSYTSNGVDKLSFTKMWAHRVNSLERFHLLKDDFQGVESDVVFDGNNFLVYHPPFTGHHLLLKDLLRDIVDYKKKIWLDLRGIDSTNYLTAFIKLDSLEKAFNFKNSAIIEVYNIDAANYFAERGYTIAMNVPVPQLRKMNEWDAFKASLNPLVKYVSQDDIYLEELKKQFRTKKIITWSPSFKNYFFRKHFQALLNDTQIDVILINIKSRYRY